MPRIHQNVHPRRTRALLDVTVTTNVITIPGKGKSNDGGPTIATEMRFIYVTLLACSAHGPPAAITLATPLSTPPALVVEHKAVAAQAFLDAGCVMEDAERLDCSRSSSEALRACRWPLQQLDVRFHPPAFVAECHLTVTLEGLHSDHCLVSSRVVVFAATKKRIVRIASAKELADTFAPVDTADEAIAFARVMTGGDVYTKVANAGDGTSMLTQPFQNGTDWELRLFHEPICSCDQPVTAVDYRVSRDGTVQELRRTVVHECADWP
jgi:hypothetical protein